MKYTDNKLYNYKIETQNCRIRLSTKFLGLQLFLFFVNFTGWDSVTFAIPFWSIYILLRLYEGKFCLHGCKYIFATYHTWFVWVFIVNVISMFLYIRRERVLLMSFTFVLVVVFNVFVVTANMNKGEIEWIMRCYILMAELITLLMIVQRINVVGYDYRFTVNIFGKNKDPNFMAAYMLMPALWTLYGYFINKKKKDLLSGICIVCGILLSGSRASFLGIVIGSAVILIPNIVKASVFLKMITIVIIAVLLIIIFVPDEFLARFIINKSIHDDSNRLRWSYWTVAVKIAFDYPVLGAGQNAFSVLCMKYGSPVVGMIHNTFLEVLCDFGFAGIMLFMVPIIKLVEKAWKNRQVVVLAVLTGILFASLIISANTAQYFWFDLALCGAIVRNNEMISKNEEA